MNKFENFGRIFRNFSFLFAGDIFTRILQLAAVIYLARILGVEGFGVISFALAVYNYLLYTTNLGLNEIGVREVASSREDLNNYAYSITLLRFLFSILSIILIYTILLLVKLPYQTEGMTLIFSFALVPYALSLEWVFRGTEKMHFVGVYKVINSLFYVALIFLVVKNSLWIYWVGYSKIIADSIATLFIFLLYIFLFNKQLKFVVDVNLCKKILKIAIPVAISFAVGKIYNNIDTVMLGFMKGNYSVGIYNAAYKILIVLNGLVLTFVTAMFPTISRMYKESKEELSRLIEDAINILLILGIPIGVGGTMLANKLIGLIYGVEYMPSVLIFQILVWSAVINFLGFLISYSIFACNMQKKYMYIVCFTAAFNIIANLILIPVFDSVGAAVASVVSQLLLFIISWFTIRSIAKIRVDKYLIKPILASLIMALALFYFHNINIFLSIGFGTIIYFSFLFLIYGEFKQDVFQIAKQFYKG